MSKESIDEVPQAAPSLRERFSRAIDGLMAGDSYVIFAEGGVMPVRDYGTLRKNTEVELIDNSSPIDLS